MAAARFNDGYTRVSKNIEKIISDNKAQIDHKDLTDAIDKAAKSALAVQFPNHPYPLQDLPLPNSFTASIEPPYGLQEILDFLFNYNKRRKWELNMTQVKAAIDAIVRSGSAIANARVMLGDSPFLFRQQNQEKPTADPRPRSTSGGSRRRKKTDSKQNCRRSRRSVPWAGWGKLAPNTKQRKKLLDKCGKKCFLGPDLSFPICPKNSCKVNKKGLYAAYIRSRQWGKKSSSYKGKSRPRRKQSVYNRISRKAKKLLRKMTLGRKWGGGNSPNKFKIPHPIYQAETYKDRHTPQH